MLSGAYYRFCLKHCQGKTLYAVASHPSDSGYPKHDLSLGDRPGATNLDWLAAFQLARITKQPVEDWQGS